MKRCKLFLRGFYLVILSSAVGIAQVHFTFTSPTSNNATVGIPTSANPNISGTPLANGDEIGAFTPAGLCVGAVVWSSTNTALAVWGCDSSVTPVMPGVQAGQQISYRVWRQSTNAEYATVNVTYSQGNGIYAGNGIFVLSSLSAIAPPSTPTLTSPSNSATGIAISPTLSWNASTGATSYGVQASTSSSFSSTVVNQTGITTISYAVRGLANSTIYYWRVNATNASGTSAYSATWSFTTATAVSSPSVPTLTSPSNGATGISTSPTVKWNACAGATSYQLQVSASSSFSKTVVNQSGITTISSAVSGLTNNTTYYWRVNARNTNGASAYSSAWAFRTTRKAVRRLGVLSSEEAGELPGEFTLSENHPNPFNPSTIIEFSVPRPSFVTLKVFNILGQEVATLVDGETETGTYKITFDASAVSTSSTLRTELGSGVYFYRLTAGDFTATKKMLLIR